MQQDEAYDSRDEFGDKVEPRSGFVYPSPGDRITALKDYKTAAFTGETTVRAGDTGIVLDNRKPGAFEDVRGYMGLVVHFERVAKTYRGGFVIRWDAASDPAGFAIRPPSPAELKAEADEEARREEAWRQRSPRLDDEFGKKAAPRGGFFIPEPGDKIIAVKEYQTGASGPESRLKAGDTGVVTGVRMAGEGGYIGLIVEFERVKKHYTGGFVIRWDDVSDLKQFVIPAAEEKTAANAEAAYAAVRAGAPEALPVNRPLRFHPKA